MEADDLDNLIADSLGGVQSALEADRRPGAEPAARASAEAVRELRAGPKGSTFQASDLKELFSSLDLTLQDPAFQKAMTDTLRGTDIPVPPEASEEARGGSSRAYVEEHLEGFLKSFDKAVANDSDFDKRISNLMTSMLSNDLICEPLQQIADVMEPWLKSQKGLPSADRTRYEAQLRLYRRVIQVYKSNPDPLPTNEREEVQRLLLELQGYGQPPDEVVKQITPKPSEEGEESFEDFMKSMGLDAGLGAAEQELLKKLSEDPEELTKAMKEMANDLPEEGCKQQ